MKPSLCVVVGAVLVALSVDVAAQSSATGFLNRSRTVNGESYAQS